jgi:succinate dehydrogenase / fumarate reductase membrane anchor subunit
MADIKAPVERPLSPHLFIYKPMLTMMMSIVHRITGGALYFGTLLVAWWLIAAATSPNAYAGIGSFMSSFFGRLILFGYTWALVHHMLGRPRLRPAGAGVAGSRQSYRLDRSDHRDLDRGLPVHGRAALMAFGTMRTPLGRVRGLGAARSGTEHFWRQRLTAVANIPLTIAFIFIVIGLLGRNHAAVVQIIGSPLVAVVMLLFILSVTMHMRIGMQVIIEDYVHDEGIKMILIMANTFFAVAVALASAFAILTLSFKV